MKTDMDLQREIAEAIAGALDHDMARISVIVQDGIVTLNGHVCGLPQKWMAEYAALYIYGVRAISNHIDVWLTAALPRESCASPPA